MCTTRAEPRRTCGKIVSSRCPMDLIHDSAVTLFTPLHPCDLWADCGNADAWRRETEAVPSPGKRVSADSLLLPVVRVRALLSQFDPRRSLRPAAQRPLPLGHGSRGQSQFEDASGPAARVAQCSAFCSCHLLPFVRCLHLCPSDGSALLQRLLRAAAGRHARLAQHPPQAMQILLRSSAAPAAPADSSTERGAARRCRRRNSTCPTMATPTPTLVSTPRLSLPPPLPLRRPRSRLLPRLSNCDLMFNFRPSSQHKIQCFFQTLSFKFSFSNSAHHDRDRRSALAFGKLNLLEHFSSSALAL